ncbi:ABC transporter ATP-binding protein [Shewanella intestini]|uniref:ABC transporter ATP-binding protein n=1 Tax=Shewanella intestini TaxID=2017544 RepID=A0ABS5I5B1_9GAMM|nr:MULTISPECIES: ABC transporter ATP-binding protein [Shewanella]MBR9729204.1 ABC transporter ATP-binding protein [Shewanella intestini]MRG37225.1 ATP-binding cassette domain-containing protein [Shewanella sp. XMDDZSB0408]
MEHANTTPHIIRLTDISKSFVDGDKQLPVLNQLTLALKQGDTVALTGASGSGKSTLLNIIAGFEYPSQGELQLIGQSTKNWQDKQWSQFRHQQLGMVFQQFNLLTPLNVRDNIRFSLQLNRQKWNDWCDHLVDALGLASLLNREVESLSGGQQQRVAIARALAHQPALLLADEPTGNLDYNASLEVMSLLTSLAKAQQTCVLMVTHSEECAQYMQQRWHLENGAINADYSINHLSQTKGDINHGGQA